MALKIAKDHFEEAKQLVKEGDTDLIERRKVYEKIAGRPTNLDDDAITVAAWTEDADDDEFVGRVKVIELEGYEITA